MPSVTASPARRPSKPKAATVVSLALSIDHAVYLVAVIPAGEFGRRAVRLTKKSDGEVYDVLAASHGIECSCPDFVLRREGEGSPCKHGAALVQVGLLEAPAVAPAAAPAACCPAEEPAACGACVEAPAPVAYPAFEWASAILGELAGVATERQVDHARFLLADDWLCRDGVRVSGVGPELADLRARLRASRCGTCGGEGGCPDCGAPAAAPGESAPAPPDLAEGEELAAPEEVDAISWAWRILGKLRSVADPSQVSYAETITAEDVSWQYVGETIRPLGPSLAELEAKHAARGRRPEAAPAPLPRPLPKSGSYGLADLAEAQGDAYAALGNAVGDLFARTMKALAASIRATGAQSVAEFEARAEVMEADRLEDLRQDAYERGRAESCRCGEYATS